MKCEAGRIIGGVWEAVVTASEPPAVEAVHGGRAVEGVTVKPGGAGRFIVKVPIPAWALNEGLQTILVHAGGERLAVITLVAGEPLDDNIRTELTLLRVELDLLKRAFQRHVREG
jgi:hypothetical protein